MRSNDQKEGLSALTVSRNLSVIQLEAGCPFITIDVGNSDTCRRAGSAANAGGCGQDGSTRSLSVAGDCSARYMAQSEGTLACGDWVQSLIGCGICQACLQ